MPHFTGYRLDLENRTELLSSSIPFRDAVAEFTDIPDEIDPRPWHRIEMQGGMGSCQGHALSSVCEMAYHIATGQVTQFSPLFGYYVSQKLDGLLGRDAGSTIMAGVRCAKEFGQCPADVMPYPNPVVYTGLIPSAAYEAASPFRIRSHAICKSYEDVFTFLSRGLGGVEIGIPWGNELTPRDGRIERFVPGGGGHAVCFLGYSRRRDSQGRRYLWLANSWSSTWGNNGWAEVAPVAVDQMGAHPFTTMVGLSDLSVPVPRNINWQQESIFA
jgi:Papain family cysteine protease